jgi:osmoprotectant transport system permease protein
MTRLRLIEQLGYLPDYLGNHIILTILALMTGIIVCLPLAVYVTRVRSLQWPTLAFASVMQTIPGIALLALMVPLLGEIGFLPAFIALVLYSMLPIIRNTVTGITGVDASLIEAARGIGMTSNQMLFRVEVPLAAPVIIAGIRTATVWVVGTATLSTPVGATSLGNYIFGGLQTQNAVAVIVGCVAAAALAIVLDQVIRLFEMAATKRSRRLAITASAVALLIIGGGLTPVMLKARTERTQTPVVVGAKTFTEQYILSQLLTTTLNEAGLTAVNKSSLGSTVLFDALASNNVDCYVDYSGTIWANIMRRDDIPPRQNMLDEMALWLKEKHGIVILGSLGFENTYTLAISREKSVSLGITSLSELSRHASMLSIGSDYEFFNRPEWAALKEKYNLHFSQQRTFDPSLMYTAVREGKVDVISAYSTDGRIVDYDLVVLADPKRALPPYDAVLLLSPAASKRQDLVKALGPLVGTIDDVAMRQANKLVDVDRKSVQSAATFLRNAIHKKTSQL